MEFDKFLERDMIEFLDSQAHQVAEKVAGAREEEFDLYEITQDYSKDINQSLKEGNLKKAQNVFNKVRLDYMNAPDNSLNKKRLYIIMEEIYEKIKDYESQEEGKQNLFETIQEYEQKGLFTRPDLFQKREITNVNLLFQAIDKKEKELEFLTSKKAIAADDIKRAVKEYRDMKELIKAIPKKHEEEKKKRYESALTWFYTIKKLKKAFGDKTHIEEAKPGKAGEKIAKLRAETAEKKKERLVAVEDELGKIRMIKEKIVFSHNKISQYLKNKELTKSMREYKNLKKLYKLFPSHLEEEKTTLLAEALGLYESIKKLKMHLVEKKKMDEAEKQEEKKELMRRAHLRKQIHDELAEIKEMLTKQDAVNAIAKYKEMKELFKQYPDDNAEDKKHLYDEIMKTHKDIKLMEDDLKRKTPLHKVHTAKAAKVDDDLKQAHELLNRGKSQEATHKILEAKHKIEMLPKESFDEKYRLLKEVEKLEHKTIFVKNVSKISTPQVIVENKASKK